MDGVVLDEAGDPVEGGVAFVEEGGECLEDVRDTGGDVQDDGHIVGCCLAREAGGVVEEHLVRSGLDQQRRESGEVGEDGADQGVGWVCASQVVRGPGTDGLGADGTVADRGGTLAAWPSMRF